MKRPVSAPGRAAATGAASVLALAPLPLADPDDLRLAFDLVREHPTVVAAHAAARNVAEREAVSAATAALVRRTAHSAHAAD